MNYLVTLKTLFIAFILLIRLILDYGINNYLFFQFMIFHFDIKCYLLL
jgi:hypothetical protein